ncbi:MAG: Smr/MutS family protein [Myxococcales bacterium]|nr:Smr/MutS family protein [Myxococcales bacterium]
MTLSSDPSSNVAAACFEAVLGSARSGAGAAETPARVFVDLDWQRVCDAVAHRATSRDAAELAADLGLLPPSVVARRRAEVDEAAAACQRDVTPPLRGFDSVGDAITLARKADAIRAEELARIGRSAEAAGRVAAWTRTAAGLPNLAEQLRRLADVRDVAAEIARCIDVTGAVADAASPELGPLRRRVARLRDGILQRLEKIVRSPRYDGILQDDYVTLRDDRYVLPVRAGERGDFPGIVHAQSGSGQTLFIEPQELIEPNNELRLAQLDVDAEVHRILCRLTDLVRRRADDLESNQDILTYVDLTFACARLAVDLGCTLPDVTGGAIELRRARHPVLALRELDHELRVVPNDLTLTRRALIVSGPNTGGKTVTLKTLGLFALMTRAGLPLPVDAGSRFPIYDRIFSDVGDDQGVDRDLSTFSGHVANIASFLPRCGTATLVLLDELFAGTDPEQGAALGRALLGALVDRGATVVVTTHLESLKTLGFADERFASASVAFDVERMRPSYRLRDGVPGGSYALRIAARLGLDPAIIETAESLVGNALGSDREAVIARLEAEHARLVAANDDVAARLAALAQREAAVEATRRKLAAADRDMVDDEARKLRAEVARARAKLREASARLRATELPEDEQQRGAYVATLEAARAAANEADAVTGKRAGSGDGGGPALGAAEVGQTVWVRPLRQAGVVLAVDAGRVTVQVGAIRSHVALSDLGASEAAPRGGGDRPTPTVTRSSIDVETEAATRVDLRGERADDAVDKLDAFLERALRTGAPWLVVVHGHGTGVLKRAVRARLDAERARVRWRPGEQGEGGDGVTIVEPA